MMSSTTGHKHDATTAEGPKIIVSDLSLTSGAAGDILYHNGTNLVRLAIGTAAQVLKVNAGATAPEWGAGTAAATQAEQETGSSTTVYVSPGRQQFHPSAAKGWCKFDGSSFTGSGDASYNVSSITDSGVGRWVVNWATDFSSANFAVAVAVGITLLNLNVTAQAAGTTSIDCDVSSTDSANDGTFVSVVAFGDQA